MQTPDVETTLTIEPVPRVFIPGPTDFMPNQGPKACHYFRYLQYPI